MPGSGHLFGKEYRTRKSRFKWAWTFRQVNLEGLGVHVAGDRAQVLLANLSVALTGIALKLHGCEPKPWKVTLNGLDVSGFAVDYRDTSRTPGIKASVDQFKVGVSAKASAAPEKTDPVTAELTLEMMRQ